mgnify:CR=1 FL=1
MKISALLVLFSALVLCTFPVQAAEEGVYGIAQFHLAFQDAAEHHHRHGCLHGVPGDANNPVGWEEIEVKFRDCVSFTDTSAAETDRAIETVANFEICDDVTDILRLIA